MHPSTPPLSFDLSGFGLVLRGLPPEVVSLFHRDWNAFLQEGTASPVLDAEVHVAGTPPPPGGMTAKQMTSHHDAGVTRFSMAEGAIEIRPDGTASVRLAPADASRQFYAMTNFIVAAMAVRLPSHGGAVLHAAGAAIDGRGFALVGSTGSGKSTWAAIVKSAGGIFLSDDLIFVDAGTREILSTPIRGDHPVPHGPHRWPLRALLLPRHGRDPALSAVSRMSATVRLAANLPFAAEQLESDPYLGELIQTLVSTVPAYELTFARDSSFMELLTELG